MTEAEDTRDDGVDPELLMLPEPPRSRRALTLVLMALVVVGAATLALSLRHEVAFFLSDPETTDLGDVTELDPADLRSNSMVRVAGTPMMSRAVRYRRVLSGTEYVVFPLAGQRTVYVQVAADADLARHEFSGRLVTFGQLGGRIGAAAEHLDRDMGLPVTSESFLLMAEKGPSSSAWALLLSLLCLLAIAIDLFLFFRWFRPIRDGALAVETAEA
ncbi:MAG: hypothetical protein RLO52_22260 [Sandaracinaceae bacterium]|nr:MAG: hypothetical protein EVA89_30315 [Sandaracinaceae bacterium]HBQ16916.1 hypothetical protein [Myxococcales bacterium]